MRTLCIVVPSFQSGVDQQIQCIPEQGHYSVVGQQYSLCFVEMLISQIEVCLV